MITVAGKKTLSHCAVLCAWSKLWTQLDKIWQIPFCTQFTFYLTATSRFRLSASRILTGHRQRNKTQSKQLHTRQHHSQTS